MARKTGKDVKIEIELGNVFYPMAALSTVSSPAADVGKKWSTNATYISDRDTLKPVVRMDGVISGFQITAGSGYNEVDVAGGTCYIQGALVTVTADTVSNLYRPTVAGQVRISAICVNSSGTISARVGAVGAASTTRGAAGGKPFIPLNEVLLGYVTMEYYTGSASGQRVVTTGEIDSESKERTFVPSYEIIYHDGSGDNATNVGVINFATALTMIHAATYDGPGTAYRNVYASYYDCEFEQLSDAFDFSFSEDIATIASRAYQDAAEEKALSISSWSCSGSAYWDEVQDVLTLIKNSKRWVKFFPDVDEDPFWVGRGIIKVSRSMPVGDNFTAAVTIEGSGELYNKSS